jgi:hypothetical protein
MILTGENGSSRTETCLIVTMNTSTANRELTVLVLKRNICYEKPATKRLKHKGSVTLWTKKYFFVTCRHIFLLCNVLNSHLLHRYQRKNCCWLLVFLLTLPKSYERNFVLTYGTVHIHVYGGMFSESGVKSKRAEYYYLPLQSWVLSLLPYMCVWL